MSCLAVLVSYEDNVSLKTFYSGSIMKISNSILGNFKKLKSCLDLAAQISVYTRLH